MGRSYTGIRARATVIRVKSRDRGDPPRSALSRTKETAQKKTGATQG
jgi:hypothetical protein